MVSTLNPHIPVRSHHSLCLPWFTLSDSDFLLVESNPESSVILMVLGMPLGPSIDPSGSCSWKLRSLRSHWVSLMGGAWTAAWKPGRKFWGSRRLGLASESGRDLAQ